MRKSQAVLSSAVATAAIALLAACSSGGMQSSTVPAAGMGANAFDLQRAGIPASSFAGVSRITAALHPSVTRVRGGEKDLYVTDWGTGAVEVLHNGTWSKVATITSGISGPDGDFVDNKGNIYIANYHGVDVTEYQKNNSLAFTYNLRLIDPVGVTVDARGNVYVADNDDGNPGGFVGEYAQHSNKMMHECLPGGGVIGVAVDSSGDVFADYNVATHAEIIEYAGGLKGCHGTKLDVTLDYAGGMVLDKNNNIVVCDQTARAVDVIAPPYHSVTSTLGSGYSDPFHVTINKDNTEAFVADVSNRNVRVLSYPSGKNIITLGAHRGLSDPAAAADGRNFVP